jgi:hypothetical protein
LGVPKVLVHESCTELLANVRHIFQRMEGKGFARKHSAVTSFVQADDYRRYVLDFIVGQLQDSSIKLFSGKTSMVELINLCPASFQRSDLKHQKSPGLFSSTTLLKHLFKRRRRSISPIIDRDPDAEAKKLLADTQAGGEIAKRSAIRR